jgi:hypothetical protein
MPPLFSTIITFYDSVAEIIGGAIIHWTKRTIKSGMYLDAIRFLARGWPMVLAALAGDSG